ncbi:HAD family hydrolase [Natronosporangium hydrolyticum]|uniref:HAD family hydrolase n=1 Tax=Natronosporangium hydrolyticum TaxID=2811111 RepID=A0A895YIM7_9ACTN|nr:HAD hydrolase-like protein [Natronosporangium hydrolyticum]QSB14436.1 HAD family hydrolase [Natronosporangium hydrolyticum]
MSGERHLVWDWNGTLSDDLTLVVSATNAALGSVGGPEITAEQHRQDFRRPIADYYAGVLGRPVDAAEFVELDRRFHEAYLAGLPCELAADAEEALRAWSGTQSLLSMWFHSDLVPAVAAHGLTDHFARIDGVPRQWLGQGSSKGPRLVAHLTELGLTDASVVMIGDTVDDAHAAAAAGADCVLYSGGFSSAEQLRTAGVPVVDTLLEAVWLAQRTG